ncbi:neuromedin-U receptor 2-like [Mizuhopecten yessoensis]|uniref:neuromedin-U receptor 2-like n=1 Tax=Mizuhopecten yessoensis TaxID=6573 RepID=UPI000B45A5BD|nr:neuromedin-U receptor 2-like [Mizuhopecten yessoensis]
MNRSANDIVNNTMIEADSIQINSLFPILFQTNDPYVITLHKYIMPILAGFVFICNSLTIAVFWKIKLRNPTHMLLLSICLCDMLGSFSFGVIDVYVFYFEDHRDYLPYRICELYTFLYNFLPVFFHYSSTYLTVGLAIERYICVVYPFRAKLICSKKHTLIFILFSVLCSGVYLTFQIYSHTYYANETSSFYLTNVTVQACSIEVSNFTLWYLHPILFILLPLVILICIEPAILKTLKRSNSLRTASSLSVHKSSRNLSVITIWVVFIFIVCEVPILFYVSATFVCLELGFCSFLLTSSWMIYTHYTVTITASGQLFNFIIYITCNRRFRRAFGEILTGRRYLLQRRFTAEIFFRETQLLRSSRSTSLR